MIKKTAGVGPELDAAPKLSEPPAAVLDAFVQPSCEGVDFVDQPMRSPMEPKSGSKRRLYVRAA